MPSKASRIIDDENKYKLLLYSRLLRLPPSYFDNYIWKDTHKPVFDKKDQEIINHNLGKTFDRSIKSRREGSTNCKHGPLEEGYNPNLYIEEIEEDPNAEVLPIFDSKYYRLQFIPSNNQSRVTFAVPSPSTTSSTSKIMSKKSAASLTYDTAEELGGVFSHPTTCSITKASPNEIPKYKFGDPSTLHQNVVLREDKGNGNETFCNFATTLNFNIYGHASTGAPFYVSATCATGGVHKDGKYFDIMNLISPLPGAFGAEYAAQKETITRVIDSLDGVLITMPTKHASLPHILDKVKKQIMKDKERYGTEHQAQIRAFDTFRTELKKAKINFITILVMFAKAGANGKMSAVRVSLEHFQDKAASQAHPRGLQAELVAYNKEVLVKKYGIQVQDSHLAWNFTLLLQGRTQADDIDEEEEEEDNMNETIRRNTERLLLGDDDDERVEVLEDRFKTMDITTGGKEAWHS